MKKEKKIKILIAIDDDNGKSSKLSEHFGHCPYFGIYETDTKNLEIFKNKLDHSNPNLTPVDQIITFKPNIVFSKGMGGRAIKLFNKKDIKIKTGDYTTVFEVIENLNDLNDLTGGCNH